MTAFQVLARRYRPQRFEDLLGQETAVRTLANAISSNQIGHAYLFSGLRGVGKTTAARLFAKALNCEQGPTSTPCGICVSCQEVSRGSSLDVLEIDAASNRGIDEVRELREVARLAPARDRYRVFILDEAHQITREAFPALLKILEEPPDHVVFILASTEKDKFPATILSRCQQIDFRPLPTDLIVRHLQAVATREGFALSEGAALQLGRVAGGSLRDGLSLLDRVRAFSGRDVDEATVAEVLGLPPAEVIVELWQQLAAGQVEAALAVTRREERAGHDLLILYEQLVQLLDTLLLLVSDPNAPIPFAESYRGLLVASATEVGTALLLRLLALALEQRSLVAAAEDPALAVRVAIGRLALWPRLRRVEALLAEAGEAPAPPSPPRVAPPVPTRASGSTPPVDAGPATLASQLEEILFRAGHQVLASRIPMARRIERQADTLVLGFTATPRATVESVQAALATLRGAVQQAGLASDVRVEVLEGADSGSAEVPLAARVEADERVRRVLEVFGGRIERVEEPG